MTSFIAVHIGAGNHSKNLQIHYEKLCRAACRKGMELLRAGDKATVSASLAVALLEDSPLTNAGIGSNLTWDGTVECDACLMDGDTLCSVSIGAVSSVKNPVLLANALLSAQRTPLSLGRVPPCMLVGSGATEWARESGVTIVDPDTLITDKARRYYHKYKEKAMSGDSEVPQAGLDTVGAVVVDNNGRISAACSSGGIILKHSGRVGQGGVYGCGCWAEKHVGVSVSGCGEDLIRTTLARQCATELAASQHPPVAINKTIVDHFLHSPFLWGDSQRLCGVLAVKTEEDNSGGELVYGHTTATMGIGYMSSNDRSPKSTISRLPQGILPGTSPTLEGVLW